MTIPNTDKLAPQRPVPISTTVDGVRVAGEIVSLYPNDIEVEITDPFRGLRTGVHVPAFAMHDVNRLAEGDQAGAINRRGLRTAEWLLRVLYDHARGKPTCWGVSRLTATGWRRIGEGR